MARSALSDPGVGRVRIEDLKVGDELDGIISSVAPFGVFVDIGADRDGLVHISKVANGYVGELENHVQPGEPVKVWVVGVSDDGKLDLSMINDDESRRSNEDYGSLDDISPETWLDGVVQDISDFGIFVTLTPPGSEKKMQGLVHISQIKDGFVDHPAYEAEVGQEVKVRVLSFDRDSSKLKLTMRAAAAAAPSAGAAPRRGRAEDLAGFEGMDPNEWVTGRVDHIVPFGVFVELAPPAGGEPAVGMVHVSEIRDGFVEDPANEVEDGQEVQVRVLSVDAKAGRMGLSMKPPQ